MNIVTTQGMSRRYGVLSRACPRIDEGRAAELLIRNYGFSHVALRRINTEKDDTFLMSADSSPQRFIFRIEDPEEPYDLVMLRVKALRRLEFCAETIPVTRIRRRLGGGFLTRCESRAGTRWATLTTVVPGRILAQVTPPYSVSLLTDVGRRLAQIERELAPLTAGMSARHVPWDPRLAPDAARDLTGELQDGASRRLVLQAAEGCRAALQRVAKLPSTMCHGDFHPGNMTVADADRQHVAGIFDFGDMHAMPAVCDVGTCLLYFVDAQSADDPFAACRAVLGGYVRANPAFDQTMIALLPAVMRARCILTILLPLLAVASDRSRAGHYQATAGARIAELRLLCSRDEHAIAQAIAPAAVAASDNGRRTQQNKES